MSAYEQHIKIIKDTHQTLEELISRLIPDGYYLIITDLNPTRILLAKPTQKEPADKHDPNMIILTAAQGPTYHSSLAMLLVRLLEHKIEPLGKAPGK